MKQTGYTRNGVAVVSTDDTKYELLKRDRDRKRLEVERGHELDRLRELVLELKNRVETLERKNG
jgi:hypothetical protein